MATEFPAPGTPPSAPRPAGSSFWQRASPLLSIASLLAVGALWYRYDAAIADLTTSQHQLAQDVASQHTSPLIDVSEAPFLGSPDALATFIEYSDYECPFCIRHTRQTMPQIDADFIQTGKVRYVFKDFPIDQLHPDAIRAHEAGRCAAAQDKFWKLHYLLFSSPGTHTRPLLEQRASEAGLSMTAFRACLDSGRSTAEIHRTVEEASNLGAQGTPAFFLGMRDRATYQVRVSRAISGAQPYEVFEQALRTLVGK